MTPKQTPPRAPQAALSPSARQRLAEAGMALSRNDAAAAERALADVLAEAPDHVEAQFLLGIACMMRGDSARALPYFRHAASHRPNDATIAMNLGSALYDAGFIGEALPCLRRACELAPGQASVWYNLGKALKLQRHLDEADAVLRRAVSLDDRHVSAHMCLADNHTIRGEIHSAAATYRKVLQHQPDHPDAWHALANLKTQPFGTDDTRQLQRALRSSSISTEGRVALGFSLFKALEDQGDDAGAFAALREANALKRSLVTWNAAEERAIVDAIADAFRGPLPDPVDPALGREVIFIVSLPRSGSTLVEQILASHPDVEGANEIDVLPTVIEDECKRRGRPFSQWAASATAEEWVRLGRDYLSRTANWREQRPRFTDKNLLNWKLVGAALAMLPGARVVNCHRDDVETCFACYRQLFSDGAFFSYDLDEMAEHYRDYRRLAHQWLTQYPGRVLDFSYENLLEDTERQIRGLLDFCGLRFDPACLAPHRTQRDVHSTASAAQVREPLRRDTARSARYAQWLKSLQARLSS